MDTQLFLHTLLYIGVGFGLYIVGIVLFALLTKTKETKEIIENGNVAVAIKLGGKMIGMGIVVYSASTNSVDILDMVIWALFGMAAQIVGYLVIEWVIFPKVSLAKKVEEGNVAVATMLLVTSILIGLSIAGAISYDPAYELLEILK